MKSNSYQKQKEKKKYKRIKQETELYYTRIHTSIMSEL